MAVKAYQMATKLAGKEISQSRGQQNCPTKGGSPPEIAPNAKMCEANGQAE
jgi:hypothetical protein